MSIELILAIIFFGLLPLIERLIRAAREGQGGTARPAPPPWEPAEEDDEPYVFEPPPMPMPMPMPAPRVEKPRPTAVKAAPVTPRVAPSRAPSRVTAHDRRTDDAFKGARKGRARRDIAAALHSEAGLRRAVVLMTILGPCRALSPYDR
jgi:outer membrane biosynthesis protein TonB